MAFPERFMAAVAVSASMFPFTRTSFVFKSQTTSSAPVIKRKIKEKKQETRQSRQSRAGTRYLKFKFSFVNKCTSFFQQ